MLCNNKEIWIIICLFIALFSFLIFHDEYLFTHYILLIQRKNFSIFGSKISRVFFNFAFFSVIYNNLHTFVCLYVMLCNNKAICSINYLFIPFFSFLIFDYEYLFTYYIILMKRKNFSIFVSKISRVFFNFAFFSVIYNNLHTFVFLYVMLCNNKEIWIINCLFIALFSFLIFHDKYLFTHYILLIQRKNFGIFGSKISRVFFNFAFFSVINKQFAYICMFICNVMQ